MSFDDFAGAFGPVDKDTETFPYKGVFLTSRFFDPASMEAQAARTKYSRPFAADIRRNALSAENERNIAWRIFIDVSMRSWRGVTAAHLIPPGQPHDNVDTVTEVPFTKDAAFSMFTAFPALAQAHYTDCVDRSNFKVADGGAGEDEAKN